MPLRRRTQRRDQHPEPVVQQVGEAPRVEDPQPGRGQFQRQRHAVKTAGDARHSGRVFRRDAEATVDGECPLRQQAHRLGRLHLDRIVGRGDR